MAEQCEISPPAFPRLRSLDALRGFDMLWIIGAEAVVAALAKIYAPALNRLNTHMQHVPWEGFRFYDFIFPLFVFIAGVSMAFSTEKHRQSGRSDWGIALRILRRTALLIFLGFVYNGFMNFEFEKQRWFSVLGLIGLSTGIAGLLMLKFKSFKAPLIAAAGIWGSVFAIQMFVTIDGFGGSFAQGKIINVWFDSLILKRGAWDPEGVLCIISAVFLPLIGCAAGRLLIARNGPRQRWGNVLTLIAAGALFLGLAYALDPAYPIIKKAWTGSFNLMAAGLALLLFAAFHAIIDVIGFHRWSFPLQVIGVNAITVYLGYRFIAWRHTANLLFGGTARLCGDYKPVVIAVGVVVIQWLVLFLFYRKKIFVKL